MKKIGLLLVIIMASVTGMNAQKIYKADHEATQVKWVGKKIAGAHEGTIALKEGWLSLEKNSIKGGEFIMDMNSIRDTDIKDEKTRAMLEGHLKSDDFFGVELFPLSKLVIKGSTPDGKGKEVIKADLTIKSATHPVEFTATSVVSGDVITYNAVIPVDRTLYDVRYGSGKFFSNIGDKAIDDIFTLTVTLVVKKQ